MESPSYVITRIKEGNMYRDVVVAFSKEERGRNLNLFINGFLGFIHSIQAMGHNPEPMMITLNFDLYYKILAICPPFIEYDDFRPGEFKLAGIRFVWGS